MVIQPFFNLNHKNPRNFFGSCEDFLYFCQQIFILICLIRKNPMTMKRTVILLLLASVPFTIYAKKKFAITTSGENLSALTQVTDNAEPCINPFGGDNGMNLYFSVRENKKYYNIYKKENPLSRKRKEPSQRRPKNRRRSSARRKASHRIRN